MFPTYPKPAGLGRRVCSSPTVRIKSEIFKELFPSPGLALHLPTHQHQYNHWQLGKMLGLWRSAVSSFLKLQPMFSSLPLKTVMCPWGPLNLIFPSQSVAFATHPPAQVKVDLIIQGRAEMSSLQRCLLWSLRVASSQTVSNPVPYFPLLSTYAGSTERLALYTFDSLFSPILILIFIV